MLVNKGVDIVFPINSSRHYDFRSGRRVGKKDHVVQWKKPARPDWMDKETYKDFPDCLGVREVEVSNFRAGFRTKKRVIVTTFLDQKEVSKEDLGKLYDQRWLVEINLRSIKDTMQMGIVRGRTPKMVRKEIWMHLLAYNLVRKIMGQAAILSGRRPQELSFKLALQLISVFRQEQIFCSKKIAVYYQLLKAIAYKSVGNRPGRIEPRAVKRRPKAFPKLQMMRALYKKNRICYSLS
jgi:hypothetical protein